MYFIVQCGAINFIRFLVISGQGFKAFITSEPETVTGFIQRARAELRGAI
jgi:hypothetical protein